MPYLSKVPHVENCTLFCRHANVLHSKYIMLIFYACTNNYINLQHTHYHLGSTGMMTVTLDAQAQLGRSEGLSILLPLHITPILLWHYDVVRKILSHGMGRYPTSVP